MTVNEMIISFSQYYDKMTNLAAPGYEDSEILLFLNNGQDSFIKARTFGDNFQPPAFENNQKRVADLRPLVTVFNTESFTDDSSYAKARILSIPAALMFVLSMTAKVTRTEPVVAAAYAGCDFIRREDAVKFDVTGLNKPFFLRPKFFIEGSGATIMVDAYTENYCKASYPCELTYIKIPTALIAGGSCDFEDYTHQEIVDIAVREAMQVSQDQRFETKVIEEKKIKTQ